MPLPIFAALAGAGLMGAKSYYENTANENPSYLNAMFGIQKQSQPFQNLGQVDLNSPVLGQQFQALAAQSEDPQQQQYLLSQAVAARNNQMAFEERMMGAQQANQAAQIQAAQAQEQEQYRRVLEQQKLEEGFRNKFIQEFGAFSDMQSSFQGLENTLANGSPQDAVAATFQIMKTLDPTSTVRTEEGRQVVSAEGPMKGMSNELNRIIGEGWNESTRREWYETVARVYKPRAEQAYRGLEQWRNRAMDRGFAQSAIEGAGIDRERLIGTVSGSRESPFGAQVEPPADGTVEDGYTYHDELPTRRARTRRERRR
jgi:hypothetical protein